MWQFLKNRFEAPGVGHRILPMEGLRGLAGLLVFFVHFNGLFYPYIRLGSWMAAFSSTAGNFGHAGVDLFFVLSGFLIYGIVIEKHPKYRIFIWRRALRLYPVFLAVLSLYLGLSLLFPAESKLPHSISEKLVYVGGNLLMLPGMTRIPAMITVAWSLSYEWFFYLTLPLLVGVLGLRRWSSWQRVGFFLFLPAAYCVLWSLGLVGEIRLILFAAGIVLWELVDRQVSRRLSSWMEYFVTGAFLINLLAIGLNGAQHGETDVILSRVPHFYAPSLFLTLVPFCLYAMFFNGFLQRLFSWDYLRWLGNISYSYYLIHGLALHGVKLLVNRMFPSTPGSGLFDLLLLGGSLSFSIFCAAILYLFVEKPLSWSKTARSRACKVRSDHTAPAEVGL